MEPLKVTLRHAKETKNRVRDEEPESDQPIVIGTLYGPYVRGLSRPLAAHVRT